jgi:hypothetical protein
MGAKVRQSQKVKIKICGEDVLFFCFQHLFSQHHRLVIDDGIRSSAYLWASLAFGFSQPYKKQTSLSVEANRSYPQSQTITAGKVWCVLSQPVPPDRFRP